MSTLSVLSEPISEASPCGEDLLFSADFDAIQNARRFEDPSLDQGEWVTEIKEADWSFVIDRSSALLREQTKDLRLAVWLTEALGIKRGVAGLSEGYALISQLCERYWATLHPLPEVDDVEYRMGNIVWLIGRTAQLLLETPLTDTNEGRLSALDWEVAGNIAQAIKRDPNHAHELTRGKVTVDRFDAVRRATPARFYAALLADLKAFEQAMLGLERELDVLAKEAAPSFRQAKDAYETVFRLVERFARDAGVSVTPTQPKPLAPEPPVERAEPSFYTPPAQVEAARPVQPQGVQTREQAVAQLREVAAFLRRTEPHSPAAYLADKAAHWAEMSLHEWLSTVVKDHGTLGHIRELLGIVEKPDAS